MGLSPTVYSLDVRTHHRIREAQRHLPQTLVKLMKKLIDNPGGGYFTLGKTGMCASFG